MASEYGSPVLFTKEKNVWVLSARLTFDVNGTAALDTNNSKGFCAVWQNTPTFTAGTTASSSTIGSISSFQGLYAGMTLTVASSAAFLTVATIGSISASTDTFVTTAVNNAQSGWPQTSVPSIQFIVGSAGGATGQYILQLGQQAATRLTPWVKLLAVQHSFDMACGSCVGTAAVAQVAQQQLSPVAPSMQLIRNNTSVRTIPATLTSGSSDCSITVQFGSGGTGKNFAPAVPAPGEAVRIFLVFGNSTAP